jgi:ABC-type methionine transport system ATPase subunit
VKDFCLSLTALTIPLQTHNVAMTSSIADYVVSLGLDGRVVSCGSVSDVVAKDKTLAAELVEGAQAIKDEEKRIDQEEPDATAKQADGKLIVAEEIAEGHVRWDACKLPFTCSAVPLKLIHSF